METSSDNIAVSPFVTKVFDVDLLREKILECAIFVDNENELVRRKACSYRLVSKTWLQSISRILLKLQEPLFRFEMEVVRFNTRGRIEEKSEVPLDIFVESVAGNKLLDERVPPFSINAENCYLQKENWCKRLLDCLTHCGDGLVQLNLQLLDKHACLTYERNLNLRLPQLHSLTFTLSTTVFSNGEIDKQMDVIQSIFNASQRLKSFVFKRGLRAGFLPDILRNLVLPSTLQHVDLNCTMDDSKLNVLLKNQLPKLKSLKLRINKAPLQYSVVTCILENVGKTLEQFEAATADHKCDNRRSTTFRLPFMDKLKRLGIDTPYLELEEPLSGLERLVPNLSHMTLTRQLAPMFRKWIERSCFESVSSLTASLLSDETFNVDRDYPLTNFDVDTMNILNAAFPNLVELDIVFCAPEIQSSGFVVMMQLSKLKSLKIRVENAYEIQSADVLDALLLGITQDSVTTLRKHSDALWEHLSDVRIENSIRNLKNLESLHLSCATKRSGLPFISDLSFVLAFLKMPRLISLHFSEAFSASSLMAEKWRNEGRTIERTSESVLNDD